MSNANPRGVVVDMYVIIALKMLEWVLARRWWFLSHEEFIFDIDYN
jgi:hypothetical protein